MTPIDFALSVVASATTIPLVFGLSCVRNRRLERLLHKELAPNNFASVRVRRDKAHPDRFDDRVGIGIKNETGHSVTIRRVTVRSGKRSENLTLYDRATMSTRKSFPPGASENNWGWVELPPFSRAIWFLENDHDGLGEFDAFDVELVYPTVFGRAKKIVIYPNKKVLPELLAHLQQGLAKIDEDQSAA
jgi:hypothetical protein